jgi:type I restriction enzyme R subunit
VAPALRANSADFKNATRLFQDPEFDGEPVTVYEPRPDEPIVPAEDPTITDSTGDTGDASGPDTEAEPPGHSDDDLAATWIRDPMGRQRYTIDDVRVRTAIERSQYLDADGRLVTEEYRVLHRDEIRKTLRLEFASLAGFLRRWTEAERKQAVLDELSEQGVPMEVLREAVPNGEALDAFDLVAQIAFDQPPLSRRERAENVRERNYFGKYGADARAVLDALLDKYADHGIADIEDPKVLELPPFDRIGSKTRIRRGIFGGADKFSEALTELERQLYRDSA